MPALRPRKLAPGAYWGQVVPRSPSPRVLHDPEARSAFAARYIGEAWSEAPAGPHPFGDFANPWTVSGWARELSASPVTSNIVCTQTASPVDFLNVRRTPTGLLVRFVQSPSRTIELAWTWPRVVDLGYHHVVVRYELAGSISVETPLTSTRLAASLRVWVDGVRLPDGVSTGNTTGDITSSLGPAVQFRAGGCPLSDGIGIFDEVALYDRAVTDYERIQLEVNQAPAIVGSAPYHYYRMGDDDPGAPSPGELIDSGSRGLDLGPHVPSGGGGGSSTGPGGSITVSDDTP